MKTKSSVLILSAIFAVLYLCQTAIAQITFVQTPTQQRPQGQGQSAQPGLSPEKKKSLSKYGPEDAFPGAREQEGNQRRSNRTAPRQSTPAPQPTTPAPSPTITPSTVTAVLPTPVFRAPTPLATVAASTEINKSQTGKSGASVLVPVTLSAAMLLVFGALIYVVGMLRKKLKQEN
ncbi:MAG: hypothetical protein AAB401_05100 [Acidobacteriota bacterium]